MIPRLSINLRDWAEDWDINMILVLKRLILTLSRRYRLSAEVAIIDPFVVL